jgi:hypothetical protein
VYDWSGLDASIAAHKARGATITYTVYGTPTWAATATGQTHQDAYGAYGGADKPSNISYLSTFITALVTRYGSDIKYIEIWNEPTFVQNWTGFFWGSAIDLVAMGNAIYTAAKAVNPNVIILSPGFSGNTNLVPFLSALDPVSGKYGHQVCDHVAIHPYSHSYRGLYSGSDILNVGPQSIITTRVLLDINGYNAKDIYITEWGLSGGSVPTLFTEAYAATSRRSLIARTLFIAAAAGVKMFSIYSYDHFSLLAGDYINDFSGVRQGLKDIHENVVGKTITSYKTYHSGAIEAIIDGQIFRF